jgi:hypothetical protein
MNDLKTKRLFAYPIHQFIHPNPKLNMEYVNLSSIAELTNNERNSIREHCALSGLIKRMEAIRSFLIDQIHEKRAVCRKGRFRPNDPIIDKLYTSILFGGKKRISSFDRFPSSFKCYLDDLLFRSVKTGNTPSMGFSLCSVYYGTKTLPLKELQDSMLFNTSDWELHDPAQDATTLFRFRDEFLGALQHLANSVQRLGHTTKKVAELKREITRYSKASTPEV